MSAISRLIRSQATPSYNGNIFAYNNASVQYLGRQNAVSNGTWTGWGGNQILFKVRNTSFVNVYASVIDPSTSALCFAGVAVDNSNPPRVPYYWSSIPQIFSGNAVITIPVPNDGNWHTLTITPAGFIADTFNQISKVTITGFEIGGYGEVASWTQGATRVQCIGDSWMGSQNDWPRLMSTADFILFPIAAGGMTCAQMDTQYSYDYAGVLAASDPVCDKALISFGVNDRNAGITVPAFQTSLTSLVAQVRVLQPSATIYFIQVPDNGVLNYDQYGTAMSNVQAVTANSVYIPTTSIAGSLTWADAGHLDGPSKQILATYVTTYF